MGAMNKPFSPASGADKDTLRFWDSIYKESAFQAQHMDPVIQQALESAQRYFQCDATSNILDIGCGRGDTSLFWAGTGAQVTALDFSPAAIAELGERCTRLQVSNVRPVAGDAMAVDELGKFDFVFGSLILHHLEPFTSFSVALRQALRPSGKAFFYENNGASDFLMWLRDHVIGKLWIPKWGDKDESPLAPHEIESLRALFTVNVHYPEMKFFQLAATYLFGGRFAPQLKAVDRFLYKHDIGVRYSYRQYVMLEALR